MPITKYNFIVKNVNDLAKTIRKAFEIAQSGRPGPVLIDIPKDVTGNKAEYEPVKIQPIVKYKKEICMEDIDKAVEMIEEAKRPFVFVGGGAILSDASEELRAFVDKVQCPVCDSLMGKGAFPGTHVLYAGMLGMHGSLANSIKTQECDVLIAVGMRFDDRITGKLSTYARQAKKIHFEIDPSEVNKNVPVDVAVLGNCKQTLAQVLEQVKPNRHTEWIDSFGEHHEREKEAVIEPEIHPADGPIKMGEVVRKVTEMTGNKAVLVTDVGQNQMMAARYFKFSEQRSIVTSGGMGTMGFGLPAAIGATFGAPGRMVCLFLGDGGIQMTLQELGTIMEQRSPVKIILLNNNYLGNVRQWQEMFFGKRYSFTPMMNPDYNMIASAYGIPNRTVVEREDLAAAIQEMVDTDGPYLLQVAVIEEGRVLPMCCPGNDVDDMVLDY